MEQMTILYAQQILEDLMDFSSSSDEDDEILAVLCQINEKQSIGNLTSHKECRANSEKTNAVNKMKVSFNNESTKQNYKNIVKLTSFPEQLYLSSETIDEFEKELSEQDHAVNKESDKIDSPTLATIIQKDTNITSPNLGTSLKCLSDGTCDIEQQILPFLELKQSTTRQQPPQNFNKNNEIFGMLTENELEVKENEFVNQILNEISEKEFKQKFKFERNTATYLMEKYSLWFFNTSYRESSHKVMVEINILTFLWFCGNENTLSEIAEMFNISSLYMHKNFENVLKFLVEEMAPEVIKFPNTIKDKEIIANDFKKVADFPNVLGCMADSYFPICTQKLAQKIKSTTLYLRGICDANLRFLNVNIGIGNEIITDTFIKNDLPNLCFPKYHVLAEEKYCIREYVMIPFKNVNDLDESEKYFNINFNRTHVKIKNAFGNLRSRFRQLKYLNLFNLEIMSDFLNACCVLHNICIDKNDFYNEEMYTDVCDQRHPSSLAAIETLDLSKDLGIMKRFELKNILFNAKT